MTIVTSYQIATQVPKSSLFPLLLAAASLSHIDKMASESTGPSYPGVGAPKAAPCPRENPNFFQKRKNCGFFLQ